jgi:uncharacterized protein YbjT (DUF2867 family)
MVEGTVLVTGAAGGLQGKTGRRVTELLRERGVPVRAMVRTSGIGAAHVRATVFFENIRSLANATIASGVFMAPLGDDSTVIPLVAGDDVARVAAAVLTAADVPPGNSYSVISQVLTVKEIVAAMARGLGREGLARLPGVFAAASHRADRMHRCSARRTSR